MKSQVIRVGKSVISRVATHFARDERYLTRLFRGSRSDERRDKERRSQGLHSLRALLG